MKNRDKPEFVRMFITGRSVSDTASFFGIPNTTAEAVLREAIKQLSVLNGQLGQRINGQADPNRIGTISPNASSDNENGHSEAVLTPNEGHIA